MVNPVNRRGVSTPVGALKPWTGRAEIYPWRCCQKR